MELIRRLGLSSLMAFMLWPGVGLATPSFNWDFKSYYPHGQDQPSSLSTEQAQSLAKFNSIYFVPKLTLTSTGLTQAELDEALAIRSYFGLSRDATSNVLTGRGIVVKSESDAAQTDLTKPATYSGDFLPKTNRLVALYAKANATQRVQVAAVYRDVIEHFLDQKYLPGYVNPAWLGNGYTYRNQNPWGILRIEDNVLSTEERDLLALSIFYITGGDDLLIENATASLDIYYNYFPMAFKALGAMSDSPRKWQLLQLVRRGLDVSLVSTMNWDSGTISPTVQLIPQDGSIIHHSGYHISYADYEFLPTVQFHTDMSSAGFSSDYSEKAVKRVRQAALAWAFSTTGGIHPLHMQMRAELPSEADLTDGGVGRSVAFLKAAADLTAAYQHTVVGDDLEMAYAAVKKAGEGNSALPLEWRSLALPSAVDSTSPFYTATLQGHYSHTTNGVAVHRGADWMASIRGANNYWRGGESYDGVGYLNHFNLKALHGSLMIYAQGRDGRVPNEVDSGYRYEGWNPNYFPNVTTHDLSLTELLYFRSPAYFSGESDLMGSANLRESGVWMYHGATSDKSAFFLGNRIVLVTNNITSSATGNVHTGLIQQAHNAPEEEAVTIDGAAHTETGNWELPAGGGHTLLDANGTAYYIHATPSNPAVKIARGTQEWTYALSSYWAGSGSAPFYDTRDQFIAGKGSFTPTSASFTRAWFDHGAAPQGQSAEYTVFVKPTAGQVEAYATAMANTTTAPVAMARTAQYHFFNDAVNKTKALAVFSVPSSLPASEVSAVNRAGAYLWKRDTQGALHLSASSSQLKNRTAFVVTLNGLWEKQSTEQEASDITVTASGTTTQVTIPYQEAYPRSVVLKPNGYRFTAATTGTGSGSVTGTTASGNYTAGTNIKLVATADSGSTFMGWQPVATCVDGFALAADTTCTATFTRNIVTFAVKTGVALGSVVESEVATVANITAPATISISGGEYRINGGVYTAANGTVKVGDTVQIRHTASSSFSARTDTVVRIGSAYRTTFSSITVARDATPDAFSFVKKTGVALNTWIVSNVVTVSGINTPVPVFISSNSEYRINGGTYTNAQGQVKAGDTIQVRHKSASTAQTVVTTGLWINTVKGTFTSVTK